MANKAFPEQHSPLLHEMGLTGFSLVNDKGEIALPFDLAASGSDGTAWRPLTDPPVQCARRSPVLLDRNSHSPIHVLNGMGVALGDSVIGFSVVHALCRRFPHRQIVLHPVQHTPVPIQDLYALIAPGKWANDPLPKNIASFPANADIIDIGDFAYWPEFAQMPMTDFFAWALGLCKEDLSAQDRSNAWLKELALPPRPAPWQSTHYTLIAPFASTPLRAIPADCREALIAAMHARTRLPVLGFCESSHPAFHDISKQSRNTAEFLAWIAGASMLVSTDSAAVHLAAGFDVPTLAGFVSIDPSLRVAGYPHCAALDLRSPELDGRHHSDDPALIELAACAWREALRKGLPWPT